MIDWKPFIATPQNRDISLNSCMNQSKSFIVMEMKKGLKPEESRGTRPGSLMSREVSGKSQVIVIPFHIGRLTFKRARQHCCIMDVPDFSGDNTSPGLSRNAP
ncbi:hypothetical protein CDAR_619141 [Caerostris darwini]|uniref:Ycf15 n=1 Tax=Caerostris darwini TaxID=1538125 RepID=A0AAV4U2Q6_9ARAC|nr:hypothetical protein CDAR_619141 [Caerostris darwini]